MIDFWVVSVVLVVLALGFIIYPVLRNRQKNIALDRRSQNIAVFRDRLAEIEQERQAGALTGDQFEQLKTELEASLITDVEGLKHDSPRPSSGYKASSAVWGLTGLMMVFIPLVSYGLYAKWGALEGVEQYREWGNSVPSADNNVPKENIDELLRGLRERLEQDPENLDGWFMLARSSMNIEQYDQAFSAFMRVAGLLEKQQQDPSTVYGLAAQALFFAEQGQMTERVKAVLDKAFAINPDETYSLGLLGIEAFEAGRYEDAIKYWSRILEVEPDNQNRDAIAAGIDRARVAMGLPTQAELRYPKDSAQPSRAKAVAATSEKAPEQGAEVKVLVELDASLMDKASPNDVLFIFARPVSGPPIPLAVSRKTVADLPLLISLNDAMAMGPMQKISSVKEVSVVARVSKGGQTSAKAGDLEGVVSPVKVGAGEVVKVLISEQIN